MEEFSSAPKKIVQFCKQEGMTQNDFFEFVTQDKMWQAYVLRCRGFGKGTLLKTFSWLEENGVCFRNDHPAYPNM